MRTALLTLLVFLLQFGCTSEKPISEKSVKKNITFLASDDLRGRQTFSPEIREAERYIAQQYEQAGLKPFLNNENFLQTFKLIELAIEKKDLMINGQKIEEENIAIKAASENLDWSNNEDVIVTYVMPDDDFSEEWRRFNRNDDNLLIIVHPKHRQSFERYSRWINRPNRLFEPGKERSMVMVLSDIAEVQDYNLETVTSTKNQELTNTIGWIEGKRTDEFILFSAHHDHIGVRNRPNQKDSIYNGANDDASGTVAVMELAKYFASQPIPERSLIFVTFTAEEMGGYGSRYFSSQVDPQQIIAMFNIEMIGKPAVSGPNSAWITGWDKSDFGPLLQESSKGKGYVFYPDPYPEQNLFYRSDNATLARLGVPAHSISTTPIDVDNDYHQSSDEVKTLDLTHLTNTIKAIARGAKKMVDGTLTPQRVDPDGI